MKGTLAHLGESVTEDLKDVIMDEVGEDELMNVFSDTINLEDTWWFYWRITRTHTSALIVAVAPWAVRFHLAK